ncbi:MAG: hypothetical protein ACI86X_001998 [Moritella sp.]|jgi:hypothetical protein
MNRKKKVIETLKKRAKKANEKLSPSTKPRYISKAEREKLEQEKIEQVEPEQMPMGSAAE